MEPAARRLARTPPAHLLAGAVRPLLDDRLEAVAAQGDPVRYGGYFPAYLLKCLQDWFQHRGDELDAEFKHVRNALDQVLASGRFPERVQRDARNIDLLASTHHLLHARRSNRATGDDRQPAATVEEGRLLGGAPTASPAMIGNSRCSDSAAAGQKPQRRSPPVRAARPNRETTGFRTDR